MIDIYGTIGPSCANYEILKNMFREGMTGLRVNTSHISLKDAEPQINLIKEAAKVCGIIPKILIDLQGPELRVMKMEKDLELNKGETVWLKAASDKGEVIPVPDIVMNALAPEDEILLDDGKILIRMVNNKEALVLRGGLLKSGKSIALTNRNIYPPAMTEQDCENIKDAARLGVTGVMQPFVRSADDLIAVRKMLDKSGGRDISIFAKIENQAGVENVESFFEIADEIVIARGDLGNAVPLWELPKIQKLLSKKCRDAGIPFMVVTQMLASMEHCAVPTRAEVSDIYNAVCDGASSVMVTGETAVGQYPVEVIRYLSNTVNSFY